MGGQVRHSTAAAGCGVLDQRRDLPPWKAAGCGRPQRQPGSQVDRVGAEVEPGQVAVVHLDRPPLGPVRDMAVSRILAGLDARDDRAAPLATGRFGIRFPLPTGRWRAHVATRPARPPARRLGQERLAHAHHSTARSVTAAVQVLADPRAVLAVGERGAQPLQRSSRASSAASRRPPARATPPGP